MLIQPAVLNVAGERGTFVTLPGRPVVVYVQTTVKRR